MIERLVTFPANVLAFVCHGRVTGADYQSVIIPAVVTALQTQRKVRLYYETAPDFAGIEAGAMWEDFKVGVEHLTRWERIALVTDVEWLKQATRLFGFVLPGMARAFPLSEAEQARAWIVAGG